MTRLTSLRTRLQTLSAAALIAGGLGLSSAVPAAADAEQFTFDKSHAHILFSVDHLGQSTTHGAFKSFDGEFYLDTDNPQNSRLTVTIDVSSLDTSWPERDKHLLSEDFFHAEQHPNMTFTATEIEVTGEDTARVTGDLTLLGTTKPVTLDVTLNRLGTHPFDKDKTVAGFTATGTLKRSEWGMDAYTPAVGDEVSLRIDIETLK